MPTRRTGTDRSGNSGASWPTTRARGQIDLGALLDDEQRRLSLAKAGFDRAKEFTWESSAEVHIAAWRRARS